MPTLLGKCFDLTKVTLFLIGFIGLPGLIAKRFLFRTKTFICEDLGLAFTLGTGIFVPFSFFCYFFELNLFNAVVGYTFVILVLLVIFRFVFKSRFLCLAPNKIEAYDLVFFGLLLILVYLFRHLYHIGDGTGADYWYHLSQIRYLVDTGVVKNVFPFFEEEIPQWLYPYSSYYLLLAAVAKCTQTDVLRVWVAMRFVLTFVFLSCALLFFRIMLENKWRAMLATALFILPFLYLPMVSGIGGLTAIRNICYPKVGSLWIFLPAISICLLLYINKKEGPYAIVAGSIICLAFQNWHVVNAMFVVVIGIAWLVGFVARKQFQYIKKLILFALLISVIPLIWFYFVDYRLIQLVKTLYNFDSNYLSPNYYGAVPILEQVPGGGYITKASYFFTFGQPKILAWMVASFFILPFSIWFFDKNKVANSFLLGFTLLGLFLAYNPLTVTAMVKFGAPFLVRRFLFILPTAYAFAFVGIGIFDWFEYKASSVPSQRRLKIAFSVVIGMILCFPFITPCISDNKAMFDQMKASNLYELKDKMKKHIPIGSKVLSDINMSRTLGALRWVTIVTASKHMIVAMSHDYQEKAQDIKEFFSKECSAVQRAEIARKYGTNYIIARRSVIKDIQIQSYVRVFFNDKYEIWAAENVIINS